MKNIIIALIVTFSASVSFAGKIDIPAALETAEALPVDAEALGADQYIRSLLIDGNILFHKALFYLDDHPCVKSGDCNEWSDYQYVQSHVNYLGSKIIVGSTMVGVFTPARKRIKGMFEAWTKDGFKNWLKIGALSVGTAVGFLYWNDYVESLRTLPKEKQQEILGELELVKLAITKVDYSVGSNIIGSLGIGQIFGFNTVEDMVKHMEELEAKMAAGPSKN